MPQKTPKLVIPIEADIKKAAENLAKVKNNTKSSLTGIGALAEKARKNFVAFGAGLAASGLAIRKFLGVAGEFEQSIANVAAVSGGARKELEALARQTGATTVFSAKEAADAMYFLASAGLDVVDMTEVLTPALNLASAAQIGVAEATDLTINSLKIYGAEMDEAAHFTDVLAKTVQSANTDMPQLGEAIKVAGSTAKLAGVSFEDLNVLVAGLANQGIKGSEAGTKLRQSFARLLKPTAAAEKVLLKYNITQSQIADNIKDPIKLFKLLAPAVENTADATEILGVRQLAVAGLIKQGIPDLERLRDAIDDAGGTAERMAKEQLDTLQGSIKLLQSAFQEVILSGAGEGGLTDIFRAIVDALTGAVKAFQSVPGPIKAITIGIGLLTPAIIALHAALGPVGIGLLAIGAAMSIVLPQLVDFESVSKKIENVTAELVSIQSEYEEVVKRLNDPTIKLTRSERALLEIRKQEIELQKKDKISELVDLRNRLTESLERQSKANRKNVEEVERTTNQIENALKLEKLLEQAKAGNAKAQELLNDAVNEGRGFFTKIKSDYQVQTAAENRIRFAKIEHLRATKALNETSKVLNNTQKVESNLVEQLTEAYINNRDSLEGLKLTEAEINALGPGLLQLTIKRAAEIDKLTKAQKELEKAQAEGAETTVQKTQEEIAALEELRLKRNFLTEQGLATEQELTELTVEEVDRRIEVWQKEFNERARLESEAYELSKGVLDLSLQGYENYLNSRIDKTNVYNDKLKQLDRRDQKRRERSLIADIERLQKSSKAEDAELLVEKKRELERIQLEQEAEKRDKEIKKEQARSARKLAIAQRVAALFSVGVDTAKAVTKSIAASPLTFGLPWSAFATANGVLQAAAILSEPLPSIPAFAKGGNFVTKGPMLAMLGDNPGGREEVNVQPLKSFQSNDNSVNSKSEIKIEKLEVVADEPEEMFNKIYDYAKDMGMKIVRRG